VKYKIGFFLVYLLFSSTSYQIEKEQFFAAQESA